ncbi:MAG: hypothetical protein WA091_02230 [Minisyncoccales bacterium]
MKVKAHLIVSKGYGLALAASQWIDQLRNDCEEHNRDYHGDDYLSQPKDRAVVTVEFEVPDNVFNPPPAPLIIQGELVH